MKTWKWLALGCLVVLAATVASYCVYYLVAETILGPETIRVPRLHGDDVTIPVTEMHKLGPIHWAMLLDREWGNKKIHDLFTEQCQRQPDLEARVLRLFGARAEVEAAQQRFRVAQRVGFRSP